jgi:hypothetical protein
MKCVFYRRKGSCFGKGISDLKLYLIGGLRASISLKRAYGREIT